jgi:hypothetical protein
MRLEVMCGIDRGIVVPKTGHDIGCVLSINFIKIPYRERDAESDAI